MEAAHDSSPAIARAKRAPARTAAAEPDDGLGWVLVIPITLVALLGITMYLASIAH